MVVTGNIRLLAGHIGAEIAGIDLRQLDDDMVAALREAWLEHKVLFFPRQELSADELVHVASCFGEVDPPHSGLERHPDNSAVMIAASRKGDGGGKFNAIWHSDVTFDETPPAASMLRAETLPPVGGWPCQRCGGDRVDRGSEGPYHDPQRQGHEGGTGTQGALQGGAQPCHPGDGLVISADAGVQGPPCRDGEPGLQ